MYQTIYHFCGVEVIDSYKTYWDKETIDFIYKRKTYILNFANGMWISIKWHHSKFSLYLEWFIYTLCYRLNIKKDRAKDVFFEFDKSWFKNLFK